MGRSGTNLDKMKNVIPAPLIVIIAIIVLVTIDLTLNGGSWLKALDAYVNELMWKIGPI